MADQQNDGVSRDKTNGQDRLRERIVSQIQSGDLRPGEPLHSVRELSERFGISVRAVRAVLCALAEEGWVYAKHRSGTFVAERATINAPHEARPVARKRVAILRQSMALHFEQSPFFREITDGLEHYVLEHGGECVYTPLTRDGTLRFFEREAPSIGVVVVPVDYGLCDIPRKFGLPAISVVELPHKSMGPQFDAVLTDNTAAARDATRMLLDLGHEQIAHLAGDLAATSGRERLEGYKEAMGEAGIETTNGFVEQTDWTPQGGYEAMLRLLARKRDVTAVFAATDLLLYGALRAIHECGKRVPDDISVIGFDDFDMSRHTVPPLTTMRADRIRMGQTAGQLALKRLAEPDSPGTILRLQAEAVLRQSTKALDKRPPRAAMADTLAQGGNGLKGGMLGEKP